MQSRISYHKQFFTISYRRKEKILFFHRFVKLSHEQRKNLINSITFITYRYMLATIFISHLTILGLSYKSIQSYQRKWSRDETWVKLTTYFHEYSEYESTIFFYQILCNICFDFLEFSKLRLSPFFHYGWFSQFLSINYLHLKNSKNCFFYHLHHN